MSRYPHSLSEYGARRREEHIYNGSMDTLVAGKSVISVPLSMRLDSMSTGLPMSTLIHDFQTSGFPVENTKLLVSQITTAAQRAAILPPRPTRNALSPTTQSRTLAEHLKTPVSTASILSRHRHSAYESELQKLRDEIGDEEGRHSRVLHREESPRRIANFPKTYSRRRTFAEKDASPVLRPLPVEVAVARSREGIRISNKPVSIRSVTGVPAKAERLQEPRPVQQSIVMVDEKPIEEKASSSKHERVPLLSLEESFSEGSVLTNEEYGSLGLL